MKNYIILIVGLFSCLGQCQYKKNKLLSDYSQYEVLLHYENDFNNDGVKDLLYILNSKKEDNENLINNNNDSLSKRKLVIYLGTKKENFIKVFDNDNIVPCGECGGKSDNLYSDIIFKNNTFSYTTCRAPFASDSYSIITYTFKFLDKKLMLYSYHEVYIPSPSDDDKAVSISLDNEDLVKSNGFNYYTWNWYENININNKNLTKINDIAFNCQKARNFYPAIDVLNKIIQKYPDRVVAYLNLADNYWATYNPKLAKENYRKYIELMKSQKKDLKKIPNYVYKRIE